MMQCSTATAPVLPDTLEAFLAWEASTPDTIDVKRIYTKIGGDKVTGLLLSQIAYWHLPSNRGEINRLRVKKEGLWWLVKKREDWKEECDISPKEFDRASKRLINRGILTIKRFRFNGSPTLHIHLHVDVLMAEIEAVESRGQSNFPKGQNGTSPKGNFIKTRDCPKERRTRTRNPLSLLSPSHIRARA